MTTDEIAASLRTSFRGPIVEADEWKPLAEYISQLLRLQREACATAFVSDLEGAAAAAHAAYQEEAHRRGDVRHADAYSDLPDSTKEWDRVLCRWASALVRTIPLVTEREP